MPGEYYIIVEPSITSVQYIHRWVPIELWEEIKAQLQKMITLGIITLYLNPTAWISSYLP